MAQTTGSMSGVAHYLGMSTDGAAWVEVSGYANSVEVSGGERNTGAAYTADGDTPIIKSGKRTPLTVTFNAIYTEAADEAYDEFNDQYETAGGGAMYLRWSPAGGGSGDLGYTTSAGVVKMPVYPPAEAESGEVIAISLVLECASITESTIGTAGW